MQATWAEWEELSPCSQTCGGGFQTTRRQCVNGTIGIDDGCNINEYLKIQACGTVIILIEFYISRQDLSRFYFIFRNHVFSGLNGLAVHLIVDGEPNPDHVVKIEKNLNVGVVFVQMLVSGVTGDNLSNHVPKVFYFSI